MKKLKSRIVLSDRAIDWIVSHCPSYISYDFAGYLFTVDKKRTIGCAVNLRGQYTFYSLMEKRPIISKHRYSNIVKKLLKRKFLVELFYNEPYPEFARCYNVPFNSSKATIVHDYFFYQHT